MSINDISVEEVEAIARRYRGWPRGRRFAGSGAGGGVRVWGGGDRPPPSAGLPDKQQFVSLLRQAHRHETEKSPSGGFFILGGAPVGQKFRCTSRCSSAMCSMSG